MTYYCDKWRMIPHVCVCVCTGWMRNELCFVTGFYAKNFVQSHKYVTHFNRICSRHTRLTIIIFSFCMYVLDYNTISFIISLLIFFFALSSFHMRVSLELINSAKWSIHFRFKMFVSCLVGGTYDWNSIDLFFFSVLYFIFYYHLLLFIIKEVKNHLPNFFAD